jgi:putative transposase
VSTYTQIYYHVVFSTKGREPALAKDRRKDLFRYIWGILNSNHCHLHRLNGVEDHIHFLMSLHPTVALATLIRDLKTSTTAWIRQENVFEGFPGWQDGYGAFTKSHEDRDRIIEYIKNQEEHHRRATYQEELRALLKEAGIEYEEKYLG